MSLCTTLAVLFSLAAPNLIATRMDGQDTAARKIAAVMQRRSSAGDFNGTVLVARDGNVVYEDSFGDANREWNVPNDLETKFEIGSMTKQFTALLVLQL
jgi:CubicO group peptidase (beta-lactamase class C family)